MNNFHYGNACFPYKAFRSRMQSLSESRGGSKVTKPIFSNSGKRYPQSLNSKQVQNFFIHRQFIIWLQWNLILSLVCLATRSFVSILLAKTDKIPKHLTLKFVLIPMTMTSPMTPLLTFCDSKRWLRRPIPAWRCLPHVKHMSNSWSDETGI